MNRVCLVLIIYLIALGIWSCSENKVSGNGGGMETTNGIAGYVVDDNGPVANAEITLIPIDFDPSSGTAIPDSLKAKTDSNGYYLIENPEADLYNVLIENPSNNTSALIRDYKVVADVGVMQLPEGKLQNPSTVEVSLRGLRPEEGGKVYIPGTNIIQDLTPVEIESGVIELTSVPIGVVKEIIYKDSSGVILTNLLTDSLNLQASDTLKLKPLVSGIEGVVLDHSGRVDQAQVVIIPSSYDPSGSEKIDSSLKTLTDNTGYFFIKMPPVGTYNIVATHPSNGSTKQIQGFSTHSDSLFYTLPNLILETSASIELSLVGMDEVEIGGSIFIPGTQISHPISGNDLNNQKLILNNVPTGTYTNLNLKNSTDVEIENVLNQPISLISGENLNMPALFQWKNKIQVGISNQIISQSISETLLNFPLLLRLDSTVLNFSEAQSDGSDLRIIDNSNKLLSYEIENWDSDNQKATIWVKVDSITSITLNKIFFLHYNKSKVIPKSSGSDVFETSNHFTGVYHLNEGKAGIGIPGIYKDASGKFHGDDLVGSDKKNDFIGPSEFFDGDDYVDLPPSVNFFKTPDPVMTISGWFNSDSLTIADSGGQGLRLVDIHRSDTNGSSIAIGVSGTNKLYYYNHFKPNEQPTFSTIITANTWYNFSVTYDGAAVRIYLNGVLDAAPIIQNILAGGTYRAKIGKYGSTPVLGFIGSIDEIRISNINRSGSWIKLSYENQKLGSTLVTYQIE